MDLGQDVLGFGSEARELGYLEQVEGLAACLFERVVDQDGVCLIPAATCVGSRVRRHDAGIGPDTGEALVDLDLGVVVGRGEAKLVAGPDQEAAFALFGGEQLLDHLGDVLRAR